MLMGIQAYISCTDLWLPSSGLMQTHFKVFWLLLSHWDNYPRPYHVSQDLEGLTVIIPPLVYCTDEKRTLMKVRLRERDIGLWEIQWQNWEKLKLLKELCRSNSLMAIKFEPCVERDHGTEVHAVDANNQQRYSTDGSECSWPRPG